MSQVTIISSSVKVFTFFYISVYSLEQIARCELHIAHISSAQCNAHMHMTLIRDTDIEGCSFPGNSSYIALSVQFIKDLLNNAQSQTCSVLLGSIEHFECCFRIFHPSACILYNNYYLFISRIKLSYYINISHIVY